MKLNLEYDTAEIDWAADYTAAKLLDELVERTGVTLHEAEEAIRMVMRSTVGFRN